MTPAITCESERFHLKLEKVEKKQNSQKRERQVMHAYVGLGIRNKRLGRSLWTIGDGLKVSREGITMDGYRAQGRRLLGRGEHANEEMVRDRKMKDKGGWPCLCEIKTRTKNERRYCATHVSMALSSDEKNGTCSRSTVPGPNVSRGSITAKSHSAHNDLFGFRDLIHWYVVRRRSTRHSNRM